MILLLGTRRIRESRDPAAQGIDWPGTLLFTAALVALTFGIVRGPQDGWTSPRVLSLLVGTAVLLAAFVAVESRRPRPMLELSLFRYPRFIGVQLLPVATGFSFIALIVYLPIWFIVIQDATFTAGLAILPLTAPMLAVPLLAGRMAQHVSPGLLSGIGFLVSALGSWALMRLSPDGGLWSMAIPMLLIGIGNGLPWGLMDALSVSVVPRSARAWRQASSPPCAWRGSHRHCRHRSGADRPDRAEAGGGGPGRRACCCKAPRSSPARSEPAPDTASPAAGGTMQATVVEYAHRAYTAAFQDIFGVLAVLSILTAVVCIVTLRQPMLDPAPEAACAESARGNGAVWRPGGARTTVAEGHTPPLSWNMLAYCCCMGCLGPTAGGSAALNGRSCSRIGESRCKQAGCPTGRTRRHARTSPPGLNHGWAQPDEARYRWASVIGALMLTAMTGACPGRGMTSIWRAHRNRAHGACIRKPDWARFAGRPSPPRASACRPCPRPR